MKLSDAIVFDTKYFTPGILTRKFESFFNIEEYDHEKENEDTCQFKDMSKIEWLAMQEIPFTSEEINNDRWFSKQEIFGGSSLIPESRLVILSTMN